MKKNIIITAIALLVLPALLAVSAPPVRAEDYPSKDIRWIIGGKPGGGFDFYARAIARYMEKYLPSGVHVIVENRPGAGHRIAMSAVYNSPREGYTIGMPMMPGLYIAQMYEKQKYDMTKVDWLAMILHDPRVLCVPPNGRYKTLDDLHKAKDARCAIVGFASESDVILSNSQLGIPAQYIAGHKNSNEAVLAALRGDADFVVFTYGSLQDLIRDKQLIPLAVYGSEERIPTLPDVPTLAELGHSELNEITGNFRVVAGPPELPPERLAYLRDVIAKAMNDPEFLESLRKANRPVAFKDGPSTTRVMGNLMKEYQGLKDELKPYYVKQ